jgi:integrase
MAEKVVLTDRALKALKPAPSGKRVVTWDAVQPYLGIRVTEKGARSFIVVKRMASQRAPVVNVLGIYPALKLIDARKRARIVLGQIAEGVDPKKAERAKRDADLQKGKNTFTAASKAFVTLHTSKNRSGFEAERIFKIYLKPTFGHKQMDAIKRREIAELLDDIEKGQFKHTEVRKLGEPVKVRKLGGPVMADHVLATLRKFMNWHAARDSDFVSPIVKGMARTKPKERARKRVLTDDELKALWAALDKNDDAPKNKRAAPDLFAALVRTLLLSAQRREEVSGMARSELEDDIWTIPPTRHKTGKGGEPKVVPLPKAVLAIIEKVPQVDKSDLVFTTSGETAFSGFSKAKRRLDRNMIAELRQVATERKDSVALAKLDEVVRLLAAARKNDKVAQKKLATAWWTLHDLRRTAKTLMARAGVRPDISERVLGHVIGGVEGVYDRHAYITEKKEALEKLGVMVQQIVTPPSGSNVVLLKKRKRTSY